MRIYNPVRAHIVGITSFAVSPKLWLLELIDLLAGWGGMRAMRMLVRE